MDAAADLVLLLTSPRVAPGLLSRVAWQALEAADRVLCADASDGTPVAVADSGIAVEELPDDGPAGRARRLVDEARRAPVVWIGSPDGDPGLTDALAAELSRVAATAQPPAVEVLVGSHDVAGARLLDLVAVMDRLRSPGGCPWDAAQTHESLVPYLIEEAFEAAEVLETGDRHAIREELGDVLLQVVFHARMAQDDPGDPFDVDDVAAGIVAKLVRRHPHVFETRAATGDEREGDAEDGPEPAAGHSPEQLQQAWDRLKATEKSRESVLDGVPLALPALARADKVLGRIERARLPSGPASELPSGSASGPPSAVEPHQDASAIGAALLDVVRRARAVGVDPEAALRGQVRLLEAAARARESGGTGR